MSRGAGCSWSVVDDVKQSWLVSSAILDMRSEEVKMIWEALLFVFDARVQVQC